jgi:branched-chain amino acid transport system ATP-binding protein
VVSEAPSLEIEELQVRYGGIRAVQGVAGRFGAASVTAIVGANGAGKSSLLNALAGVVPSSGGRIFRSGRDITKTPSHRRVRQHGIVLIPEGRGVFPRLSVDENLSFGVRVGFARARTNPGLSGPTIEEMFELFPQLALRRHQPARLLSGGEQQMLSIARALLMFPDILLIDEPSTGLSPRLAEQMLLTIREAAERARLTVILVEQDTRIALEVASFAYVMERGQFVLAGEAGFVAENTGLRAAYLGETR